MKHNPSADTDPGKPKIRRLIIWTTIAVIILALVIAAFVIFSKPQDQEQIQDQTTASPSEATTPATTTSTKETTPAPTEPVTTTDEELPSYYAYLVADTQYDADNAATPPSGYATNLNSAFSTLISTLLQENENNAICAPLNLYMAMSMVAEATDGSSRQQILDLLQADSIEELRAQAGQVWQSHYNDSKTAQVLLSNSLWIHQQLPYKAETAQLLSEHYYASIFCGELGSEEVNQALLNWLNDKTGGLLKEQIMSTQIPEGTGLALASTVLYKVEWRSQFPAENNTQDTFHTGNAEQEVTFMHKRTKDMYYWTDHFGAVAQSLKDGSQMWLLLPNEGLTPQDILPEFCDIIESQTVSLASAFPNQQKYYINLSLPQFDVASKKDLKDDLISMGITDVFQPGVADFSPIVPRDALSYIDKIDHAARFTVNENGVSAAAYTLALMPPTSAPPTADPEELDFILDRPFIFYIESQDGLPLFAGIVNTP